MNIGHMSRDLRRGARALLSSVIAVACLLSVAGCANIGTISEASLDSCTVPDASTEPNPPELPDVTAAKLSNPRTIEGPTTAYTRSDQIIPVSNAPFERQTLPVTVTSADGPEQTVTDTTRILALNQNGGLAAAVYALGFGCNLVGRDTATGSSGMDKLPKVTANGMDLNAEAIMALSPTVIITDTSIGPYDVQLQLRQSGVPVVFIPLVSDQGVKGVGTQIQAVADALGVSELGKQLVERTNSEIDQTIAAINERFVPEDADRKPRIVFLYVRGTSIYYWFGEGSGADSLIQSIGGVDVAKEVGFAGMSPTNAEALIKAAPDVILAMTLGVESAGGVDGMLDLPGIKETPAGEHRRVVDMSDYEIMSFGPQTAQVLAALATAVYAPDLAYQPSDTQNETPNQEDAQ
ncbi:ABC transporter substrate-binding protein [Bifidobacterium callimiconis]|uniref:heme/hemin ABC transporter substrate-binding protein n=1 Tax=Bifidobacterium callimiconis TaxID=2306973 RepID=UPI001BDCBCCB|nr:ABC transporter substrate-binding protein [Bifidobacterium callimiconis]MBT1177325.1 ABC transporter substrate-binding protein [Bifidobacterium callimiconis]